MKKLFISLLVLLLGVCWGYAGGVFAALAVPPSGRAGDARILGYLFLGAVISFVLFFITIFLRKKSYYRRLVLYLFLLIAGSSILARIYTVYYYKNVIILM